MIDVDTNFEEDRKRVIRGLVAVIKLVVNIFIGIMDFIPIKGAFFSWSADAWKYIAPHIGKKLMAEYGISLDLTSGVSKKEAIISEIFDILFFGLLPTHFRETRKWYVREGKQQIQEMREVFKRRPPKFIPDRFPL